MLSDNLQFINTPSIRDVRNPRVMPSGGYFTNSYIREEEAYQLNQLSRGNGAGLSMIEYGTNPVEKTNTLNSSPTKLERDEKTRKKSSLKGSSDKENSTQLRPSLTNTDFNEFAFKKEEQVVVRVTPKFRRLRSTRSHMEIATRH